MARFLNNRQKASGKFPGELVYLGKKQMDKPRLQLTAYNDNKLIKKDLHCLGDCNQFLADDIIAWINIDGLHEQQVIKDLGDMFGIHALLLEDMLNTGQRPKVTETDKQLIVILKTIDFDNTANKLSASQISIILDGRRLITLQEKEGTLFEPIRERIKESAGRVRRKGADYLAYLLLDAIVDNYLINIEMLGDLIEKTESRLFAQKPERNLNELIYKHKAEINFLRKNIRPVKEIVHDLIDNEQGFIADDNLKYFRDLNDLIVQASESIEIFHTMLNDQMNIYHASVDLRANEIMKVLTIFSAFFIPITFIAGVYGTNFDFMPELHLKYGYLYFWILLLIVTLVLTVYFKRKQWF